MVLWVVLWVVFYPALPASRTLLGYRFQTIAGQPPTAEMGKPERASVACCRKQL